ncbi:DUF551 domain-containing protein [Klebsiella pneumoniae]|uniref:DUF551 domain-containing protein n=1 Tax=Klebsiella pneumoniae TaxID=573 RepID=UPI000802903F|nr:DUF551 domain-containing protein [Klebsiella pneumoniae]MCP5828870.1 DUF551 domain-containing protein [Klebsiella pneumoniae]MCP5867299.1 DUF551 domain-containing protein [Klebsiella pneumoniae]MCP6343784.1 DUF551 domain-containing protein [Klebsiella pneumoniae]MDE8357124.1 DUF551 domain-containing protein [Klebsiella pneumoniae]MDE8362964.1 DUF551 domain-containing protein [Klebsiella pneumoniae]
MSEFSRETLLNIIETDHVQCGEASALARMALAAMDSSESVELPLDYLQGHKDGLEWAAQLAEANHPETGDWLYDDPIELAKAIRKGPDMPPAQPAADSEPVAWTWHYREQWHVTNDSRRAEFVAKDGDVAVLPLYRHAQAAPVVPDEKDKTVDADDHPLLWSFNEGWNACRAAMLKAQPQNAPQNIPEIIPDGWIPVSEHLPKEKGVYQVWNGKYVDNVPFWFGSFQSLHSELITHWMPLPAAPQEVKP